ncbi:MAG: hydroxyectoine utilization dehydratase EutB [Alphaproteobacteria bacterium]
MPDTITIEDVMAARKRLEPLIRSTPMERSVSLSDRLKSEIHLKLEHHQITGSFKLRGATNAILCLTDEQRACGVVAASTGNHGRGLAYAAREAGIRCVICMSELVPDNKVKGIEAQGAEIRIIGRSQDDAQVEVDRLVAEEGMTMLPPFDHPDIIAGQGTLGLDIFDDLPSVETVLVQLSGGGLMAGVALALKSMKPDVRIVGVSMERGAAMIESQRSGKPVFVPEIPTLADSLGGGIGLDNRYTFPMVRDLVDEMITINEHEIAEAIRHAYWQERQIVEGSGSVCIGALLAGKIKDPGICVALVSGGNIDMTLHKRLIDGEDVDVAGEEKAA